MIANTGKRAGADVGQVDLVGTPAGPTLRLAGFARAELKPGERREMQVTLDPQILATWKAGRWNLPAGAYRFALGSSATALGQPITVQFDRREW